MCFISMMEAAGVLLSQKGNAANWHRQDKNVTQHTKIIILTTLQRNVLCFCVMCDSCCCTLPHMHGGVTVMETMYNI